MQRSLFTSIPRLVSLTKPLSHNTPSLHQSIRSLFTINHTNTLSSIQQHSPLSKHSFTSSYFSSSSSASSSASSSSSVPVYTPHEYEQDAKPSEPVSDHHLPHPIWSNYYVDKIEITHQSPKDWIDTLAFRIIKAVRFNFDWMSGYSFGRLNENKVLRRCIFLETVAGVPGSIAATMRHLGSLRKMQSDHAWIHTLLEEAENERMHLLTFIELKEHSSRLFRVAVMLSQGIFYNFYFAAYLISPRFCHRVVGYLEEEATRTYTHILEEIENGNLQHWKTHPAPKRALKYWKLPEQATMRDVIRVIRADEAHHRDVNHTFAVLPADAENPFPPGK